MWISRQWFVAFTDKLIDERNESAKQRWSVVGENSQLKVENQRLVSMLGWFQHRLTQVEQERSQLIYAATGGHGAVPSQVKISYPNFVGEPIQGEGQVDLPEVLNAQNNPFGTVGEDSNDPADQIPEHYQNMPGFGKK